jgi:hypothetical protein
MLSRVVAVATLLVAGCTTLPDADSPGAQAYARQCGACHRAYAPGTMTWPMWEYQLGRMKLLFAQLRRPWPAADEERLLIDYLRGHAGGGQ